MTENNPGHFCDVKFNSIDTRLFFRFFSGESVPVSTIAENWGMDFQEFFRIGRT